MNREIKFRAWVHSSGKPRMIKWDDINAIEWCNDKLWHHNGKYTLLGNLELMQFTGLKDKNGVDIYEGDILNVFDNVSGYEIYQVGFWNATFSAKGKNYEFIDGEYLWDINLASEVIGNIYENPKLLKPRDPYF